MTLNGVMALTLRYFNEFGKHAFQLVTVSSSIELIDQKSASVCLKKIPDIFSCNSRKHCWIFIMFGTHVIEKVSNQ